MAVFYNSKGERSESFVWKPRPACCLNADGSRDYEKLNALIKQAQEWIHEAQMLVFEQYSGTWQPLCMQSDEVMYRLAMDFEDFQQEAFYCYLQCLKNLDQDKPENFKQFFIKYFENRIINLMKNLEKQVVGHKILKTQKELEESEGTGEYRFSTCYSMQETTKEGNPKYDFPDPEAENEYFKDYYPKISKLLNEKELRIAIDSYVLGYSLRTISKKYNISYRTVKRIIQNIKAKLQELNK